jgi:predicted  nucleic acid-binding Zn-ribbon protein
MTKTSMTSLQEVQRLDERITRIEEKVRAFDPRLAEIEEPALALESELDAVEKRHAQMEADIRRLERSAQEKEARVEKLEERLNRVQNLREEAAVQTELSLIKKALGADEQETLQLLEQSQRSERTMEELTEKAEAARDEVKPNQEALLEERGHLETELSELRARRDAALEAVGEEERRVYDAFHASGRAVVVSPLTADGACGHCYGVVPLQVQNEIRHSSQLIRCEACGVILTADLEPEA